MVSYLLDTNIISDLVKHPTGGIAHQIEQVGETNVYTSVIVACELRFGAKKKGSRQLKQNLEKILAALTILSLESYVAESYAMIRTELEQSGNLIGPNDLLIAAQTLAEDMTLVTANVGEFSRVPNLKVENWLSEDC